MNDTGKDSVTPSGIVNLTQVPLSLKTHPKLAANSGTSNSRFNHSGNNAKA